MTDVSREYLAEHYYSLLKKPEFLIGDVGYIENACKYLPSFIFKKHTTRVATVLGDFLRQFTIKKQANELWPGMPSTEFLAALGVFCYAPYFDLLQRYSDLQGFKSPLKSFIFNRKEFDDVVSVQFTLNLIYILSISLPADLLDTWYSCPGYDRLALLVGRVISSELATIKPGDKPLDWDSPLSLVLGDWSEIIAALKEASKEQPVPAYGILTEVPTKDTIEIQTVRVEGFEEFAAEIREFIKSR